MKKEIKIKSKIGGIYEHLGSTDFVSFAHVGFAHVRTQGQRSQAVPNINVSELARKLGISRKHASQLVNGHSKPGLKVLMAGVGVVGKDMEAVGRWFGQIMKI